MHNTKEITPMQQAFIDALFDTEQNPTACPKVARKIAGVPPNTTNKTLYDGIIPALISSGESEIATYVAKAVAGVVDVLDNPQKFGASNKIAAAKEIMDRMGLVKKDVTKLEIDTPNALFILPAKKDE